MKSIIYLPGLGYDYNDISGYNYAERYVSSLNKMNIDKDIKYVLEKSEFKYGLFLNFLSQTTSIFEYIDKIEERKETHRIYEFYYVDSLTEKFDRKNVLLKLLLILFTLIGKSLILIKTFISSPFLSLKKRFESFYFFSFFCLIATFALLLFPAIMLSLLEILNKMELWNPIRTSKLLDILMLISTSITTMTALLTITFPQFRIFVSRTATEFLCLDYYLSLGENKLEITGKLESLVESVSERENYGSIELHGYSFGSIVIMDTLFPFGNHPALRVADEIENIVTIGCPHDFISTYYPGYFLKRITCEESNLKLWWNIYSEIDILSSNFRHDNKHGKGNFELINGSVDIENLTFEIINSETVNFWNHLAIIGFRSHRMYWGVGSDASSCLNMVLENADESKINKE